MAGMSARLDSHLLAAGDLTGWGELARVFAMQAARLLAPAGGSTMRKENRFRKRSGREVCRR
jgi:hypothetical protein